MGFECGPPRRSLAAGEQHKDVELQVGRGESNGNGYEERP